MQEDALRVIDQIKKETDHLSKGKLIYHLVKQKKIKVIDVARALQMKPAYVCHFMRLIKISEVILDGYYSKLVTISHLFVLSLLKSQEDMLDVYEKVLSNNLTVKQTEELVREKLHGVSSDGEYIKKEEVDKSIENMKRLFQAKTKIIQTRVKTKIIIEWEGSRKERQQKVSSLLQRIIDSN